MKEMKKLRELWLEQQGGTPSIYTSSESVEMQLMYKKNYQNCAIERVSRPVDMKHYAFLW